MAYNDPQSITVAGTAVSLPRTSSGVNTGAFTAPDGNTKLTVQSTLSKRARRMARIDVQKTVPDPLVSNINNIVSMSAYVVIDAPKTGYTPAEQKAIVDALAAWLAAGTGAANNTLRLVGGEN